MDKAYLNKAYAAAVQRLLIAGYGVEDIALRLRIDVSLLRRFVAILRRDGVLARMFGGAK